MPTESVEAPGAAQTSAPSGTGQAVPGVPVGEVEPPAALAAGDRAQLRLLTEAEYVGSLEVLLGPISTQLELQPDARVAGFSSIGAAEVSVGEVVAESFEAASQLAVSEVFADDARWTNLLGCQPAPDLTGACVANYVANFGRVAFRRPLAEDEVQQWVGLAQAAIVLTSDAGQSLSSMTSAMLQSPNFLYRVESAFPDAASGRSKFDGYSMATRLAFLLTGRTPTAELLDAAAAGQLDTEEGVRTAALGLLEEPVSREHLAEFFVEFAGLNNLGVIEKAQDLLPLFDTALRASMAAETRTWLSQVVLAPGQNVLSFFDSDETYLNEQLAQHYGVFAPGPELTATRLAAETGRAGIFGKGGWLAVHSSPDSSAPTRRGLFIMDHFLCQEIPAAPPGVDTELDEPAAGSGPVTTRQRFEQHLTDATCVGCHSFMDPFGFALENFDPIGRFRADEFGIPIDASGQMGGVAFNGAVEMAAVLKQDPRAASCMVRKFYGYANAASEVEDDAVMLEQLTAGLATQGHEWRGWLAQFVASEAFRSVPGHAGMQ